MVKKKVRYASVRTPEEQEAYLQTTEYLEIAEFTEDLERRREQRLKNQKKPVSEDMFREALNLRYMYGWTYPKIAKKLKVGIGAVQAWCTGKIVLHRYIYTEMVKKYG